MSGEPLWRQSTTTGADCECGIPGYDIADKEEDV